MGDKTAARKLAIACDVPIVPGTNTALNTVDEARQFAEDAGYPVMLKAAMGGGGRGMRVVKSCVPPSLVPPAWALDRPEHAPWPGASLLLFECTARRAAHCVAGSTTCLAAGGTLGS